MSAFQRDVRNLFGQKEKKKTRFLKLHILTDVVSPITKFETTNFLVFFFLFSYKYFYDFFHCAFRLSVAKNARCK
jgi:hypothetical protein